MLPLSRVGVVTEGSYVGSMPTGGSGSPRRGGGGGGGRGGSGIAMTLYLKKLLKWRQMDIEYTFWQMLHLCLRPRIVYRHTSYHKQTKNQWARDDPAFAVITGGFVAVAAAAYCVTFSHGFVSSLLVILYAVLVDYLGAGCVVATLAWFLSNRYLRVKSGHSHSVEQRVEWLYSFDVHCNAYFPQFILLYVLQFFLCPILLAKSVFSDLISNLLYGFAFSYYSYVSFLGYNALPFLERTELFLFPIVGLCFCLPFTLIAHFNPTRFFLNRYFG